ncbi:HAMP domain-containing sensor histidine kinase [Cetobacterium ceti]
MRLKKRLITILFISFSIFLGIEFIGGEFYFEKIFRYVKMKELKNISFIKGNIINYKKLKTYQEEKNAFVIILDKDKIMNMENFDYFTITDEEGIKKTFLLNAFLDNLYSNSSFSIDNNENLRITYFNLIGNYCIPIIINNKFKNYIDYKLGNYNLKKHHLIGKVSSIENSQLSFTQGDDLLEILLKLNNFSNKNIEYQEADGDLSRLIIENKGDYKVIIFYSYENINDIFPTFRIYFYGKMFLFIILIFIISKIIEKKIISPITNLSNVADEIGQLNFTQISYNKNDEIGDLYKKINNMSFRLEEMISLYKDELYKNGVKNEELEEKIKNFMHEVKTPLSAIIGFSEYLKEVIPSEEVEIIYKEGRRLLRLSNETLSLENKKNIYTFKPFDLEMVIDLGSRIFNKEIGNRNLILTNITPIEVIGDREKIEQVIFNIIKNSTEYAKHKIEISLDVTDDLVYIYIKNDGPHIYPDSLNKIWNKFYSDKNIKGRGLGLYIAKEILEAHNSNYGVKNIKKGVEFYFTLKINRT